MAISLEVTFNLNIDGTYKSTLDLGTVTEKLGTQISIPFASGTGDDQADRWTHDKRTVTNPTTDTIDLTATLSDGFGATFAPATLKGIIIHHRSTSGNLTITGNAIQYSGWAGASGEHLILPGGLWVVMAPNTGYTITNTTKDQLSIDSSAGAIIYDIYLLGASA